MVLTIRFSFLHAAVRFTLALHGSSEAPEAPLHWQVHDWQQDCALLLLGGSAASSTPTSLAKNTASQLREAVGVICEEHRCGFGRLTSIRDALDAMLSTPV